MDKTMPRPEGPSGSCKEETLMWAESSAGDAGCLSQATERWCLLRQWFPTGEVLLFFMATESSGED